MDTPALICDSSLESWQPIGSGGFGQIYKAKHTEWRMDVAVKLLHFRDSSNSSLLKEAHLMHHGGNPHVLRILGVYQGSGYHVSGSACPEQGLVMEFMERGSLTSLLEVLNKPLPLPLILRLAHQVALGMNFLHCLSPPLLHLDLKPSNVLLDDSLNAKLTDFGLAKLFRSVSTGSTKDEGGTMSYMPPEAFGLSYKPTPASDVYSYAILLWSIITGQEPYPFAGSTIVRFRIPEGDRPNLEMVDSNLAEHLKDMIGLMIRCWDSNPKERPSFQVCLQVTEALLEQHKSGVKDAVHQVLTFLDSPETELGKRLDALNITDPTQLNNAGPNKASTTPEAMRSDLAPTQRRSDDPTSKLKALPPARMLSMDPRIAYNQMPPADAPSASQSPAGPWQTVFKQAAVPFNSQVPGVSIFMSNVTGVQIGNNNKMTIQHSRTRHSTAPGAISQSSPKSSRAARDSSAPGT